MPGGDRQRLTNALRRLCSLLPRNVLPRRGTAACLLATWLLAPGTAAWSAGGPTRAAGGAAQQNALVVAQLIHTGTELADAYAAGAPCERIAADRDKVRTVHAGIEAAMKRLAEENEPGQEMLRTAFRRAAESAVQLGRTLGNTGVVCGWGGDAQVESGGFHLRLENEALFMAENGRALCHALRTTTPDQAPPDCGRP